MRLEPVPVDAYELGGASVAVGAREMTASQLPGIPGTPAGGISGSVVYLHDEVHSRPRFFVLLITLPLAGIGRAAIRSPAASSWL